MIAFQPKLSSYLYEWKLNTKRKPLIVRGARQVGKTTLIRQFATSYSHSISLNLEKEADKQLFETQDEVKTMVENLFLTHNIASEHISNTSSAKSPDFEVMYAGLKSKAQNSKLACRKQSTYNY
ncbi:MAG: AAA family ATPase [Gelidibacter sp.]|nr:AAA family ATPase [Gelidibacter sp.]